MLLPTELDTAISPNPLRATITDVISGSIVWIISCSSPCRNLAPVAVGFWWIGAVPLLDPGGPDRLSEAARDVTEPPGCVAIDVSDELAALPCGSREARSQHIAHNHPSKTRTEQPIFVQPILAGTKCS
uniref:Uncharacterized protein n=1 Tax=Anopheles atroparvus TaxID=41427 RepID=A0A182IVH6_ANOAO